VPRAAAFVLVAGHTALDFVNTVDWRTDPRAHSRMRRARMRLAVPRYQPEPKSPLVHDGVVRQPRQGPSLLRSNARLRSGLPGRAVQSSRVARGSFGSVRQRHAGQHAPRITASQDLE
jgi:hypothetical protein